MGIGRRIKEARENLGLTQSELADLIGVTSSAITNYEKETSHPKEPIMYKLIDILKVDANYLFQDVVNIPQNKNNVTVAEYELIKKYRALSDSDKKHIDAIISWGREKTKKAISPLIGAKTRTRSVSYYQKLASAGSGEYLFDDVPTDTIDVPVNDISEQADFVIGVNGDSMEPAYYDGDKVYVKLSEELPVGHIGIFTRGNDCFIKKLGADRLISLNHAGGYKDIMFTGDAINLVGEVLGKLEEL